MGVVVEVTVDVHMFDTFNWDVGKRNLSAKELVGETFTDEIPTVVEVPLVAFTVVVSLDQNLQYGAT